MTKPTTKKEIILVGVSWPYANGELHTGHLAGQYVVCDVFARYHRQKGNDVLMVSGTDAHGTPVLIRAEKDGKSPEDTARFFHEGFLKTFEKLNCEWDLFTITESDNHKEVARNLFKVLYDNGFIKAKKVEQFYDEKVGKFLSDRYITGTCPYCGHEGARGDQCNEGCERTLDPTELLDPKSSFSGETPILKKHDVLFFDLPSLSDDIMKFIKTKRTEWRPRVLGFVDAWLKEGLRERAVSRKLGYGIKIPIKEYETEDIYVWFEAVMGYLSAAIEWAKLRGEPSRWEHFWKNPSAKHYYFIGKDNIPFHTILWPAIIMAYNSKYASGKNDPKLPGESNSDKLQLPHDVPANQFLVEKSQKMSKSRGGLVTANEVLDKYNPDLVRFFFTHHAPENHDREWSWQDLIDLNNKELVATFGNLVYRTLSFLYHKLENKLPEGLSVTDRVQKEIEKAYKRVGEALGKCQFVRAAEEFLALAHFGNKYFNDRAPWKNTDTQAQTIYNCIQIIYNLAILARPFMPATSEKTLTQLGQDEKATKLGWQFRELTTIPAIQKPALLFEKLELEPVEQEIGIDPSIIIGKILEISSHPNADNLQLATVDVGGSTPRTIVCGASNIKAGDIVGVTLPGGQVWSPEGKKVKITKRKVRGVESDGMLCSQLELGLGKDHEGIFILPKELGKNVGERLLEKLTPSHTYITCTSRPRPA